MTKTEAEKNLKQVKELFDTLRDAGEKFNTMGAGAEMMKNDAILWKMFEEAKMAYSLAHTSADFWHSLASKCRAALDRIGQPQQRADDLLPSEFVTLCQARGLMGNIVPEGFDLSELDAAIERGELPEWLMRDNDSEEGQGDN